MNLERHRLVLGCPPASASTAASSVERSEKTKLTKKVKRKDSNNNKKKRPAVRRTPSPAGSSDDEERQSFKDPWNKPAGPSTSEGESHGKIVELDCCSCFVCFGKFRIFGKRVESFQVFVRECTKPFNIDAQFTANSRGAIQRVLC